MALGRKTGGRKKGSLNRRTNALSAASKATVAAIMAVVPDAFDGDAHAFLVAVYRDPSHPVDIRIEAAGKAIGYERPRLSSVEMSVDADVRHVVSAEPVDRDGEGWASRHCVDPSTAH